jgi:hypothetical protein
MGFLDRTFCLAADNCRSAINCYRYLSPELKERADKWAIQCGMVGEDGLPEPRIAWSDFSNNCHSYEAKA